MRSRDVLAVPPFHMMSTRFVPKWPPSCSVCPLTASTSPMWPSQKTVFRRVVFVERAATPTVEVSDLPRTGRLNYKYILDSPKKVDVRRGISGKWLFAMETIGRDDFLLESKESGLIGRGASPQSGIYFYREWWMSTCCACRNFRLSSTLLFTGTARGTQTTPAIETLSSTKSFCGVVTSVSSLSTLFALSMKGRK